MRRVAAATVCVLLTASLAGCVAERPESNTMPVPVVSPTPSPSSSAQAPLDGVAAERARFDAALASLLESNSDPDGRTVIDALVAAGFDKSLMEVTPDVTAIGLDADNIQFSVRLDGDCIVGQSGNVGYHSTVLPVLATNTCLVGKTRPIDW